MQFLCIDGGKTRFCAVHHLTLSWCLLFDILMLCGAESTTWAPSNGHSYDASEKRVSTNETGNVNDYIDHVLSSVHDAIKTHDLDPYYAEKISYCSNCFFYGLSTLERTGDVSVKNRHDAILLEANLGFKELRARCYCARPLFLGLTARGEVDALLHNFAAFIQIQQKALPGKQPELDNFQVTNDGVMDVHWKGRNFLGNLAQWTFPLFKGRIIKKVRTEIPRRVQEALSRNIAKIIERMGLLLE